MVQFPNKNERTLLNLLEKLGFPASTFLTRNMYASGCSPPVNISQRRMPNDQTSVSRLNSSVVHTSGGRRYSGSLMALVGVEPVKTDEALVVAIDVSVVSVLALLRNLVVLPVLTLVLSVPMPLDSTLTLCVRTAFNSLFIPNE